MNPYEVLGLKPGASQDEIKKAFMHTTSIIKENNN